MEAMTNITLSIDDKVYKKMKKYSEIKWSEFVRKAIEKRVDELEKIAQDDNYEGIMTMLASEEVLKKDWDNEADERWNNV
jgi:metal-responsive CopG/Arc/MetJ family transcriptional regulator